MKFLAPLILAASLLGCSAATVPDMTYYRLPEPALAEVAVRPFALPIDVGVFSADGLYAEQALIYTLDDSGRAVRTYHYQHWSDPPPYMLQRRLIRVLRGLQLAPQVTDRLPASVDALRISGIIQRYDRAKIGANYRAEVSLQIRVERADELLTEKVYKAERPAESDGIEASVNAFGAALDQIYAEFLADLGKLKLEDR